MRWMTLMIALAVPSLTVAQETVTNDLSTRPKLKQALSLKEAVEIALRESPVLRGAVAELSAAEERWRQALSEKRPQLSFNTFTTTGTIGEILSSAPTVIPSTNMALPRRSFFIQNAMFMFPLFTGGRLEALIRQAERVQSATAAQVEAVKLDVALETRLTYRQVLFVQELVKVAEAYIQAMEERVRIDRESARVGRIPEFWVLRSEAELANAVQMLTNFRRDMEVAMVMLKSIMGVHPDSEITLKDTLTFEPMETDRTKFLTEALAQRPEVKGALRQIEANAEGVRAAKALYKPQVSLMTMTDYMTGRGMSGVSGYLTGIVLGLPILDGGRRKAMVQENEAMLQKALQALEEVKLKVAKEVDTALWEISASAQNVKTAEAALAFATEDLRAAKARYEAGRSVLVEYLDALFAYVRARTNYAQALYEHAIAKDRLLRAVGKL